MEETILIATPVGDCKSYCIAEYLRRVEEERRTFAHPENIHLLLYGDDLTRGGYVGKVIAEFVRENKDWVTLASGGEIEVTDDNLYQSKRVTVLRQAVREVALGSPWWTHLLWWDSDVFPTGDAIGKLLQLPAQGVRAGTVPDWNSGCPAFGRIDPETGQFIFASRESLEWNTAYPADTVHLAFTLVPREVVEAVSWESDPGTDGEDGYFSKRCREEGIPITVTTGVLAKHVHESLKSANLLRRNDGIEASFKLEKSLLVEGEVAGTEKAIVFIGNGGGWFAPPISKEFHRGVPVPIGEREGALRPDLANRLLRDPRFKEKTVKRKDVRIATKLF